MKAIETRKLTKYYGSARGIVDLDLEVSEGEFFGFIGPNGAGKSTTIRTLLGLITQTSGEAEIFGLNVNKSRQEILKKVGYLPSEAAFYNGMRAGEIIDFSLKLRGLKADSEVKALCERFELDTGKKVEQLSLGNRKKVGIVCALAHRPALYVLDEPTSGLDPLMQREFYTVLSERCEEGATVFLSSHILSEVSRYCKRAAVIREGRLLAVDSVEKLGHTGVKRVSLKGINTLPEIDGISNLKVEGDSASFLYGGGAKALASLLSGLSFEDFSVTDPDLDEVFMHFYQSDKSGSMEEEK